MKSKYVTEIDGRLYEATALHGNPAIRKLNKNGGTARWVRVLSPLGVKVMQQLGIEPAMAPAIGREKDK
jgi:hypothetical protein